MIRLTLRMNHSRTEVLRIARHPLLILFQLKCPEDHREFLIVHIYHRKSAEFVLKRSFYHFQYPMASKRSQIRKSSLTGSLILDLLMLLANLFRFWPQPLYQQTHLFKCGNVKFFHYACEACFPGLIRVWFVVK